MLAWFTNENISVSHFFEHCITIQSTVRSLVRSLQNPTQACGLLALLCSENGQRVTCSEDVHFYWTYRLLRAHQNTDNGMLGTSLLLICNKVVVGCTLSWHSVLFRVCVHAKCQSPRLPATLDTYFILMWHMTFNAFLSSVSYSRCLSTLSGHT